LLLNENPAPLFRQCGDGYETSRAYYEEEEESHPFFVLMILTRGPTTTTRHHFFPFRFESSTRASVRLLPPVVVVFTPSADNDDQCVDVGHCILVLGFAHGIIFLGIAMHGDSQL
jgi:hypothetical protein